METKNIFNLISKLSFDDKRLLINSLTNELFLNDLDKYRTEHTGDRPCCPKCKSERIIKNGSQNNVQKFRCKVCRKTFGLHTGTSVHYLHFKGDWKKFIELTLESKSIRSISNSLGRDKQTIFNWRHKLLSSIDKVFTKEFKGIVEMDDMLVRFNQKGRVNNFNEEVRRSQIVDGVSKRRKISKRGTSKEQVSVLFSIDRYKTIDMKLLKRGKVTIKSLERVLDNGLVDRLNSNNIIVTDYCTSYIKGLDGYTHERLNMSKKEKSRGNYHLNTLNYYCGEFKRWIGYHFRSVSTKYLQNYLNYFKMLFFVLKDSDNKQLDFFKFSLKDGQTFKQFHSMEERYLRFLG